VGKRHNAIENAIDAPVYSDKFFIIPAIYVKYYKMLE